MVMIEFEVETIFDHLEISESQLWERIFARRMKKAF